MSSNIFGHDTRHLLGDNATHPIAPPWGVLAALLLLAGISQPRRRALPAPPQDSPLGRVQLRFLG